jgi:hypothetical protein
MPNVKLSVSVPDNLWNEAQSLAEASTTSGVVQEALSRWVSQSRERSAYAASPPEDILDALHDTRDRLVREARAEFQRGYVQGVECARRLPWWAIESLADYHKFNVRQWARSWADSAVMQDMGQPKLDKKEQAEVIDAWLRAPRPRPFDWSSLDAHISAQAASPEQSSPHVVVRALVPALGQLVPPFGDSMEFEPRTTYLRGFTQAMRDLWSSVVDGVPGGEG